MLGNHNGLGSGDGSFTVTDAANTSKAGGAAGGAGYYTVGVGLGNLRSGSGKVGGQGGFAWSNTNYALWFVTKSGDGGRAGSGGNVVNNKGTIYAYNGDMVTNGDYTTSYYEYNKDGTITSNKLNAITKKNGDIFIPTKIFAQSGVIRETYTSNQGPLGLSKVKTGVTHSIATTYWEVKSILATQEKSNIVTGYSNGYMVNQGIGSGAGYLEAPNGTYIEN